MWQARAGPQLRAFLMQSVGEQTPALGRLGSNSTYSKGSCEE